MEVPKELKALMTRYLLGEATSVEQEELENRYAADPEVFEQLVAIENELADRYARRELTASEQTAFERHVLAHPRRRARVQYAEGLLAQADKINQTENLNAPFPAEKNSWWNALADWRLAFALVSTACLLAWSGWMFWRKWQAPPTHSEIAQRTTSATPAPAATITPSPSGTPAATVAPPIKAPPVVVALTLNANLLRGTERPTLPILVVQADTQIARLKLQTEASGYPRYRLRLQNARGQTLRGVTAAEGKDEFVLEVPASLLGSGAYALVLQGINPNGAADTLSKNAFAVRRTEAAR